MKLPILKTCLSTAAALASLAALPATGSAANVTYHVNINVAALLGSPANVPYYLDVQLNGDGLPAGGTNTVTLNNFVFTLGSASGIPATFESASGNFASGVVLALDASHPLNELYQQFTPTTTNIGFDVTSTQNGSGITPDEFSVEILDKSLNPITTTAADGASLLIESINGPVSVSSVQTFLSTSPAGVVTTVSAVPEPTTVSALAAGVGMVALAYRRKQGRANA